MTADVTAGAAFTAGVPRALGDVRSKETVNSNTTYDVTRDGRLFFVHSMETQHELTRIDVVLNWFAQLQRK